MTTVTIVGGGLAGLTAAFVFENSGVDFRLIEASPVLGGRIQSVVVDRKWCGDLGPTWVWPEFQPDVVRWLQTLNIQTIEQFETGDAVVDFTNPPSRVLLPGNHGSRRIDGGTGAIIDALRNQLSADRFVLGECVTELSSSSSGGICVSTDRGTRYESDAVVIAAPLRTVSNWMIDLDLDPALADVLSTSPTWMAQQCKAVIRYPEPFWRDEGLSGRIASHFGPMVEVHDHATDDSCGTLFGFVGVSPDDRADTEGLKAAIVGQLMRCFGRRAGEPDWVVVQDWAARPHICSRLDRMGPSIHPEVLPEIVRMGHASGRVYFAVSETSTISPGLIEGAFVSGERAAMAVLDTLVS